MNYNLQQNWQVQMAMISFFKVGSIMKKLRNNLKTIEPEENQSIHEQMTPFKGMSHMKQCIKSKPHKWGCKKFARAGSPGIIHDFIIYEERGTAEDHGFSIFGAIIMDLAKDLSPDVNHKVFFDILFSSVRLVEQLKSKYTVSWHSEILHNVEMSTLPDSAIKFHGKKSADYLQDRVIGV